MNKKADDGVGVWGIPLYKVLSDPLQAFIYNRVFNNLMNGLVENVSYEETV